MTTRIRDHTPLLAAIPLDDASVDVVVSGLVLNFVPEYRPEALAALFASAGLKGTDVTAIDVPTPFASFDDYWRPFLGGQGPAPAYAMSLDESARARLRDRIRARIAVQADGSISMTARAWAIRATVAR